MSGACRLPARLHRDQRGTISIVSVFTTLLLIMLLGMVMNAGRQVDGKIRMQNAADAATYTGGVVLSRAMNTLAFTNHLLCDVFAMTAWMREARDQNSASFAAPHPAGVDEGGKPVQEVAVCPLPALGSGHLAESADGAADGHDVQQLGGRHQRPRSCRCWRTSWPKS